MGRACKCCGEEVCKNRRVLFKTDKYKPSYKRFVKSDSFEETESRKVIVIYNLDENGNRIEEVSREDQGWQLQDRRKGQTFFYEDKKKEIVNASEKETSEPALGPEEVRSVINGTQETVTSTQERVSFRNDIETRNVLTFNIDNMFDYEITDSQGEDFYNWVKLVLMLSEPLEDYVNDSPCKINVHGVYYDEGEPFTWRQAGQMIDRAENSKSITYQLDSDQGFLAPSRSESAWIDITDWDVLKGDGSYMFLISVDEGSTEIGNFGSEDNSRFGYRYYSTRTHQYLSNLKTIREAFLQFDKRFPQKASIDDANYDPDDQYGYYDYNLSTKDRLSDWGYNWSDDFIRVARDSNGEDVYESKKSFLPGDNFKVENSSPFDLLNYIDNKLVFQLFTPKKDNTKKGREKLYLDYFVAMRGDHQYAADEIAEVCPDANFYDENFFFKSWQDTKDDDGGIFGESDLKIAARLVESNHFIGKLDGNLVLDGLDVYPYVKPRRLYRYDKKIGVNGKTFYQSPSCYPLRAFSYTRSLSFYDVNLANDRSLFYVESLPGWNEKNMIPFASPRAGRFVTNGFYTSSPFTDEKFASENDIYPYDNPLWEGANNPDFFSVKHSTAFSVKNSKIQVDFRGFFTELEGYQSFNGARDLDAYGDYVFTPKEYDSSDVRLRIKIDARFYLFIRVQDIKAGDINKECANLCDSDFYDPFPFFEISLDAPYDFNEGIRAYNLSQDCTSTLICSRPNGKTTPSKISHTVDKSSVKYKEKIYTPASGAGWDIQIFCFNSRRRVRTPLNPAGECVDYVATQSMLPDTLEYEETVGEFENAFGGTSEGIVKVTWDYESSLNYFSPRYCYPAASAAVTATSSGSVDGTGVMEVLSSVLVNDCLSSRSSYGFPGSPVYPDLEDLPAPPEGAIFDSQTLGPIHITNFDYYETFSAITTEIVVDTHSNDIPVSATTEVNFGRYGSPRTVFTDDISNDLAWSDFEDSIDSSFYSLSNLKTLKVRYKNDVFDTQEGVLSYSVDPSDDEPWWKYIGSDYWDEDVDVGLLGIFRDDVPDLKFDGQLIEIKRKKIFTEDEIKEIQDTGLGENPNKEAFIIYEVTDEEPDAEGNIRNGFYRIDHLNHEGPLKDKDDKILEESPLVIYKTPTLFRATCKIDYFGAVPSVSDHQPRNSLWEPQDPYEIQPIEHEVQDYPKGYHSFHQGTTLYTDKNFPRKEYDYSVEREYLEHRWSGVFGFSSAGGIYNPTINNFYNPIDGILNFHTPSSFILYQRGRAVSPIDFTNNIHNVQNFIAKTENNTVAVDAPGVYSNDLQHGGVGRIPGVSLGFFGYASDSTIDVSTQSYGFKDLTNADFNIKEFDRIAGASGDVILGGSPDSHFRSAYIVHNFKVDVSYVISSTDDALNPFGYYPNLVLDSVDTGINRSYSQVENLTQHDLYIFESASHMTAYKLFYEEDVIDEDFEIEIDGTDFSVLNSAANSTGNQIDSARQRTVAYYLYTIAFNPNRVGYPDDVVREILLESFPEIQDFINSETYKDAGIYGEREKKYKRELLFINNIYQEQGEDLDDIYTNIQLNTDIRIRDEMPHRSDYQSLGGLIQRTAVKNNNRQTSLFVYTGSAALNTVNPAPSLSTVTRPDRHSPDLYRWPTAINHGVRPVTVRPSPCRDFEQEYSSCGLIQNPAVLYHGPKVPNISATTYGPVGYASDFVAKTRGVNPDYNYQHFYASSGLAGLPDGNTYNLAALRSNSNNDGLISFWIERGLYLQYRSLGGGAGVGPGDDPLGSLIGMPEKAIDLNTATKASFPVTRMDYSTIYSDYVLYTVYDAIYKKMIESEEEEFRLEMFTQWLASNFNFGKAITNKVNYSSETINLDKIKVKVKTLPKPVSEDGKII